MSWLGFPCEHFYQTDSFLWKKAGFYFFFLEEIQMACQDYILHVNLSQGHVTSRDVFNR